MIVCSDSSFFVFQGLCNECSIWEHLTSISKLTWCIPKNVVKEIHYNCLKKKKKNTSHTLTSGQKFLGNFSFSMVDTPSREPTYLLWPETALNSFTTRRRNKQTRHIVRKTCKCKINILMLELSCSCSLWEQDLWDTDLIGHQIHWSTDLNGSSISPLLESLFMRCCD